MWAVEIHTQVVVEGPRLGPSSNTADLRACEMLFAMLRSINQIWCQSGTCAKCNMNLEDAMRTRNNWLRLNRLSAIPVARCTITHNPRPTIRLPRLSPVASKCALLSGPMPDVPYMSACGQAFAMQPRTSACNAALGPKGIGHPPKGIGPGMGLINNTGNIN